MNFILNAARMVPCGSEMKRGRQQHGDDVQQLPFRKIWRR
jgi:hypothetical protein